MIAFVILGLCFNTSRLVICRTPRTAAKWAPGIIFSARGAVSTMTWATGRVIIQTVPCCHASLSRGVGKLCFSSPRMLHMIRT